MWKDVDWRWVADWAGRVFLAAFLLSVFARMTVSPVMRPGGAVAVLPDALATGLAVAVPLTLAVAVVLAWRSARRHGPR